MRNLVHMKKNKALGMMSLLHKIQRFADGVGEDYPKEAKERKDQGHAVCVDRIVKTVEKRDGMILWNIAQLWR
ncbi:hypothetical protein FS837_009553 [Tulasnella sp. UAMH 9824]|nr:hypothetical protein FS837_009553 [Tulasnella sp. UAMH 9824]